MLKRKLLALATVTGVLTVSGVAFSGNNWKADVVLVNFQEETGVQLVAQYGGLYLYVHTPTTHHLPGFISHGKGNWPPDPCDGLKHAYNNQVAKQDGSGTARTALLVSIVHLSNAQCPAELEIDGNDGASIVSFTPL
jgi:hypothetical protein